MQRQSQLFASCLIGSVLLLAGGAGAAPKDKAANKLIDTAVNDHYLATDFKKAEASLQKAIKQCGDDKCSPEVLAKAWMYVGIVRGSGKKDQKGAKKAFASAFEASPEVKLDENLATPPTKKTFDAAAKAAGVDTAKAEEPEETEEESAEGGETVALEASAATCSSDDDCESGQTCSDGTCAAAEEEESDSGTPGEAKKNWFGLHFALDFAFVGGNDVCAGGEGDTNSYACFAAGTETYFFAPVVRGQGGNIGNTVALGTKRILLSYDRLLTPNITGGGRVGFAFGGGPQPAEGTKFQPFHLELKAAYWFGTDPFEKKFRPYVHVGGGIAQVDTKVANVPLLVVTDPTTGANEVQYVDAWQKLGLGFVDVGGGLMYGITDSLAAQLNVNLMYMIGDSGIVLQPSLGVAYGL